MNYNEFPYKDVLDSILKLKIEDIIKYTLDRRIFSNDNVPKYDFLSSFSQVLSNYLKSESVNSKRNKLKKELHKLKDLMHSENSIIEYIDTLFSNESNDYNPILTTEPKIKDICKSILDKSKENELPDWDSMIFKQVISPAEKFFNYNRDDNGMEILISILSLYDLQFIEYDELFRNFRPGTVKYNPLKHEKYAGRSSQYKHETIIDVKSMGIENIQTKEIKSKALVVITFNR